MAQAREFVILADAIRRRTGFEFQFDAWIFETWRGFGGCRFNVEGREIRLTATFGEAVARNLLCWFEQRCGLRTRMKQLNMARAAAREQAGGGVEAMQKYARLTRVQVTVEHVRDNVFRVAIEVIDANNDVAERAQFETEERELLDELRYALRR